MTAPVPTAVTGLILALLAMPALGFEFIKQVRAPDAIVALVEDDGRERVMVFWTDETGHPYAIEEGLGRDLALEGQLADVATTLGGLTQGFVEANPMGYAVLPVKWVALEATNEMRMIDCVAARQALAATGWGAAGWNLAVIAGHQPLGIVAALVAATAAWDRGSAVRTCALNRLR